MHVFCTSLLLSYLVVNLFVILICYLIFQNGRMTCHREEQCPLLDCVPDQQVSVEGKCCKFCKGTKQMWISQLSMCVCGLTSNLDGIL